MSQPIPVMLIHGFGATPAIWIESGFKAALVTEFNLDPDLIHTFHYGFDAQGRYDSRGDIRRIASRLSEYETTLPENLQSQMARLSRKSVARGGPEAVTIVGFSMGGLVARYWMSRRRPDRFGTRFDAPVRRLIAIAAPHLGVDLLRLPVRLVHPNDPILYLARFIQRLPIVESAPATFLQRIETFIEAVQLRALQEYAPEVVARGALTSPALRQLHPDSVFLRLLNRPGTWPDDVDAALIWSDIRFGAALYTGALLLWERMITVGDLIISACSASQVPHVSAAAYPLVSETRWRLDLLCPRTEPAAYEWEDLLPNLYHGNLLDHPDVQGTVGRLLTANVAVRAAPLDAPVGRLS